MQAVLEIGPRGGIMAVDNEQFSRKFVTGRVVAARAALAADSAEVQRDSKKPTGTTKFTHWEAAQYDY